MTNACVAVGLSVSIVASSVLASGSVSFAGETVSARVFATHALALRTAGMEQGDSIKTVLANMPGTRVIETVEVLPALWSPFFTNAVVKLGRLRSPEPVALYYHPLLDIAIVTLWEQHEQGYRVVSARALPGERLSDTEAVVALQPPWTVAEDGLVANLRRITITRLDAFRQAHPAESNQAGRDTALFATAAADMRSVLARLAWHTAMRMQWVGAQFGWLDSALEQIDAALATQDTTLIQAAALATDTDTANMFAQLPKAFTSGLTLTMTLEAGRNDRLLIASAPPDSHVYVFVLCQLNAEQCALHRFLLISLEEEEVS